MRERELKFFFLVGPTVVLSKRRNKSKSIQDLL